MCRIFWWKKKKSKYHYSMFSDKKDDVAREFFHYAKDHCEAANLLMDSKHIPFMDSMAYLYHHAIEMLLKGLHMYYFDEFNKTHDLIELHNKLSNKKKFAALDKKDIQILRILNQFQYLKYPVDSDSKRVEVNQSSDMIYQRGEVGDDELNKAEELFNKLWGYLESDISLNQIIRGIDWTKKGWRQVMSKPIDDVDSPF